MLLRCGSTKMAAILPKSPLLAAIATKSPPLPPKSICLLPPHPSAATRLASCRPLRTSSGPIFPAGFGDRRTGLSSAGFGFQNLNLFPLRPISDAAAAAGGDGDGGKVPRGGQGGRGGSGGAGGPIGSEGDGGNPFSWYLMALEKYPVLTKAITSALLTLIGDLICQFCIDQVSKLDMKRTFVFTFLGLVLVGPTLHFWYLYLSKLITQPGATGAFMRLLLDQFVFSPVFIGIFLSSVVALEGRPSQIKPKLQQEWFSSVLANWQLWIPFQFLNFRFVPQKFQVLAANFVALAWNVILSFKAHKEVELK